MTQVVESPVIERNADIGNAQVAHIIRKDDQMRGYVLGETIQALCGEEFIPTRDPSKFPLCEGCKIAIREIID